MADSIEPTGLDYVGRQTYLDWANGVAARGGMAVRLPTQAGYFVPGSSLTALGEKYAESVITADMGTPVLWSTPLSNANRPANAPRVAEIRYGYFLAPTNVRALDLLHDVQNQSAIVAGKAAETAENVAKGILGVSTLGVVALLLLIFRPWEKRR